MNLNLVQVCGRITKNPEIINTQSGTQIVKFSVASNRTWKDKNSGQKNQEVEFHNVVAFGRTAEIITQYFQKGDEIYIQGRLKTGSWDDKETGQKRYRTEIITEKFEFGQKSKANQGQENQNQPQVNYNENAESTAGNVPVSSPANDEDEIKISDIPF